MTFAVPAPTRRALQARGERRRSIGISCGLGLALGLALWSVEGIAAPSADPDPHADDLGAIDDGPDQPDQPPDEPVEPGEDEAGEDAQPEESEGEDAGEDAQPEGSEREGEDAQAEASEREGEDEVEGPEAEPEDPESEPEDAQAASDEAPIRPPRFDGPYVGLLALGSANFVKVIDLATPTPLFGGGAFVQAGDAVFPWMSIGIAAGGQAAWVGEQQMFEGALLVEIAFVPVKRYPLSIRTGFGFGGGAVTEQGIDRRFGFGGALFKGTLRYEFFPLADKRRPDRGGGWAIGPELGWLGATPAAKGQPFVNTILLGLSTSFYFGS